MKVIKSFLFIAVFLSTNAFAVSQVTENLPTLVTYGNQINRYNYSDNGTIIFSKANNPLYSMVLFHSYYDTPDYYGALFQLQSGTWVPFQDNDNFSNLMAGTGFYVSNNKQTLGNPFAVYLEDSEVIKVSQLMQNNQWKTLPPVSSDGEINGQSLAVGSDNTPYVFYVSHERFGLFVKKYSNDAWVQVGGKITDFGDVTPIWIGLDQSNTPYVAFKQLNNQSTEFNIEKFSNGKWELLGGGPAIQYFGQYGDSDSVSVALSPSGKIYVSYYNHDQDNNNAHICTLDDSSWRNVLNFNDESSDAPAIMLNNNMLYYAYWVENKGSDEVLQLDVLDLNSKLSKHVTMPYSNHDIDMPYASIISTPTGNPIVILPEAGIILRLSTDDVDAV